VVSPLLRRPPRAVVFYALATAFSLLGDQALYALLPIYFEEIGLAPIHVGILLSANRWVRLITNHVAERASAWLPSRLLILSALAAGALMTVVYAFAENFLILLAARLMWGLAWSFIRHISVMAVASVAGDNLGQMMGYYNGLSRTGSIVGIVAGGFLFDQLGYTNTFVVFFLVSTLALPLAASAGAGRAGDAGERAPGQGPGGGNGALLVCGFSVGTVGPGLVMSTLGFILASRYGNAVSVFGVLVGIASLNGLLLGSRWLLETIGAPALGAAVDRVGAGVGVPAAFAAGIVGLLCLWTFPSLGALTLGVMGFFLCGTTLQTVLAGEASARGSRVYARFASASDAGSACGPLIGWSVITLVSDASVVFIFGAVIFVAGLIAARKAF